MSKIKALIVGASYSGKTTSAWLGVKWLLGLPENKGKRAIVVNQDGGSEELWGEIQRTEVGKRVRVISPFKFEIGLAVFRRICTGVWTDEATLKTTKLDMGKYCVLVVDGWTGFAQSGLEKLRSDANLPDSLASGKALIVAGERFGVNAMSHYGAIHNEVKKLVDIEIPRLGLHSISTALVDEGEDRITRQARYGPKTCGGAIVATMPSWFGDTFVQETVRVKVEGGMRLVRRLWVREFEDKNTGVPYIAGVRLVPEERERFDEAFPKGWVEVKEGLGLQKVYEEKWKGVRNE